MPTYSNSDCQRLAIRAVFDALSPKEKHYAHHMAQAAWHGARIVMEQVSPESPDIFEFIMRLYKACDGDWDKLSKKTGVGRDDIDEFRGYAAGFLTFLGNWRQNEPVGLDLSEQKLLKIASILPNSNDLLDKIKSEMENPFLTPDRLLFPFHVSERISTKEIEDISNAMRSHGINPSNTRLQKGADGSLNVYQASIGPIEPDDGPVQKLAENIYLVKGDHSEALIKVREALNMAKRHANETQIAAIDEYIKFFETGNFPHFEASQQEWLQGVSDEVGTKVRHSLGFVGRTLDADHLQCEWMAVVGIVDPKEQRRLKGFLDISETIIQRLPWAVPYRNKGKGPFEESEYVPPSIDLVHALAFCGHMALKPGFVFNYGRVQLHQYATSIMLSNYLTAEHHPDLPNWFLSDKEAKDRTFLDTWRDAKYLTTVIELVLGRGPWKCLEESAKGVRNFDPPAGPNPPINPITRRYITSWYREGQTYGSVFGPVLSRQVLECRAILISEHLVDDSRILDIFRSGFRNSRSKNVDVNESNLTRNRLAQRREKRRRTDREEFLYATYVKIGVEGLQALSGWDADTREWKNVRASAYFAIFRHLLEKGHGSMRIVPKGKYLDVEVDRDKMRKYGKPAIKDLLLRLHIWCCTGDKRSSFVGGRSIKQYFQRLVRVPAEGDYDVWRNIVIGPPYGPVLTWYFAQPNTFVDKKGRLQLREYEDTIDGLIQSWAERTAYEGWWD